MAHEESPDGRCVPYIDRVDVGPQRVQLRRTKGWRMPPDTVKVSRPSMWGNPYRVGSDGTAAECVAKFRADCVSEDILEHVSQQWLTPHGDDFWDMDTWLKPLRGKNLACWCPLDQPCHADVLLELLAHEAPAPKFSGVLRSAASDSNHLLYGTEPLLWLRAD